MTDSEEEIENVIMEEEIEVPLKKTKSGRVRKPLSDEAKEKMLANLKAGREKKAKKKAESKPAKPVAKKEEPKKEEPPVAQQEKKEEPVAKEIIEEIKQEAEDVKENKTTSVKNVAPKKIKKKKQKIIVQVDSDSSSDEDAIVIKTRGRKKKDKLPKPSMSRSNNIQEDDEDDYEIKKNKMMEDHYNKIALNMLNRKI